MGRLSFLTDEHVNRAYVSVLRSSGYRVDWRDSDTSLAGATDHQLLHDATKRELIIITNDADFIRLADSVDHAGIIIYQQYGHSPRAFSRGIQRIDRYLDQASFRNHVEWLENWL